MFLTHTGTIRNVGVIRVELPTLALCLSVAVTVYSDYIFHLIILFWQSSVPVTIFLPRSFIEALPLGATSSFLLMVVFGSLVAVFILVIICLAAYIHKNKKNREDKNAAMPTKMNHIITNGGSNSKLDPLSVLNHHHQTDEGSDITSIEAPKITSNDHKSLRGMGSHQGSKRYSRNPLANGGPHESKSHNKDDGGDSLSLNGSNATTTSTATGGSESPPNHGSSSYDGTARATGGLPNGNANHNTNNNSIPPAPPVPPPVPVKTFQSKNFLDRPSSSSSDIGSDRKYFTTKLPAVL
ncbi:hypothetical protein Anas_00859 [Armadillidium nasatum]|uniref:Uncharacterized protein n=1 Tax=Armadillidium nasatum TaxID=96803 RepID=A0A5N5SYY9_9CRUS|nr:hypothetical protein Anas_00859 [Armadillidium nasatum]